MPGKRTLTIAPILMAWVWSLISVERKKRSNTFKLSSHQPRHVCVHVHTHIHKMNKLKCRCYLTCKMEEDKSMLAYTNKNPRKGQVEPTTGVLNMWLQGQMMTSDGQKNIFQYILLSLLSFCKFHTLCVIKCSFYLSATFPPKKQCAFSLTHWFHLVLPVWE